MKALQLNRSIVAWSLYDWAASAFSIVITTFIFATYFTESIAVNPIAGTHQWADAVAFCGLMIALLSPVLGAAADEMGRRKPWIAFFTFTTVVSAALLWFAQPSPDYAPWALTWLIIGTVGLELSLVFYNAMMHDLAPQHALGRLSGWAWGVGYFGGIICLLLSLLLVRNQFPGIHLNSATAEPIRATTLLVAIWLSLFSLPLFFFTPEKNGRNIAFITAMRQGLKNLYSLFTSLKQNKTILLYLFAHMIYTDGLNTLFSFGGIYAAGTFGFKIQEIIFFGLGMNLAAGIGAISFAWIDDYIGSKYTILISLAGLILFGACVFITHSVLLFWLFGMSLAVFVGPVQSASRSYLVHIAKPDSLTELFGLYSFSGKISAFMGPWLLGYVTLHFNSQRAGMSTILLFFICGGLLLLPLPKK